MAESNICKDKELDFFLLESCPLGSRQTLLDMGMDAYMLFHSDGTVDMMMGMVFTGTWNNESATFINDDKATTMKYTLEGDILTIAGGEEGGGDTVYRRSDYAAYGKEPSSSASGGAIVSIPVTDGFITGVLSATCPDGWYGRKNPSGDMIFFNTDPDMHYSGTSIYIEYALKECVKLEGEKLNDLTDPESGRVWEAVSKDDNNLIETVTYKDGNAIKVSTSGLADGDSAALISILSTVALTWDSQESSLGICEGKETDFFELRSMTTSSSTGNRALLVQFGYDWCFLFRNDGTVIAKLDRAVTAYWGSGGFGKVPSGTWRKGVMTFTNGDSPWDLEYTLEGDRLTILDQGLPVVFQRSQAAPPDFDALA